MTVFKSFFKVMSKNIGTVILYTALLILFGSIQFQSNDTTGFVSSKPDLIIVNEDNSGLANNLVNYFSKNANIVDKYDNIDDTVFYRQANYVIYIYEGYGKDVLEGKFKELNVKSSGDYMSSLADMMLNRYLNIQNKYLLLNDEKAINNKVNNVLENQSKISVKLTLNVSKLSKLASYYNFASYSIISSIVLVITLILSSYNNINIRKRTIISSKNYKKYNKELISAASIYALIIWVFYNILGLILNGDVLLSTRGLLLISNSLLFTIVNLIVAIMISNLINNKNAISGIVNVLAVGSSFLCGVFVPSEWLGDTVLKIGHIFPTFYYVNSNDIISKMEKINLETLKPVITNSIVLVIFLIIFIVINNIITKYKRKVG